MDSTDKYYLPHLSRTIYKIADSLAPGDSTCTVRQIIDHILKDAPYLNASALFKRVYTAVRNNAITGDFIVEKIKAEKTFVIQIKVNRC